MLFYRMLWSDILPYFLFEITFVQNLDSANVAGLKIHSFLCQNFDCIT